jgi:hypothetical protein
LNEEHRYIPVAGTRVPRPVADVARFPRKRGGLDRITSNSGRQQGRTSSGSIGEMFWFAGKLGRQRVCALKKGDVEMPSDFAGVGYTKMDDLGAWKTDLLKELKAAGYEVDWGKALA